MYSVEYNKETKSNHGTFRNIKSITIDKDDIMMMKNVDIIHGEDKNLFHIYQKYLKFCRKTKDNIDKFTILNDNQNNEEIIASIFLCDWLVNEDGLEINKEVYLQRKKVFQEYIYENKASKRSYDERKCMLMQYFIDTIDKVLENENEKVLKKEI